MAKQNHITVLISLCVFFMIMAVATKSTVLTGEHFGFKLNYQKIFD